VKTSHVLHLSHWNIVVHRNPRAHWYIVVSSWEFRSPDEARNRALLFAATYEQPFLPPHYFGLGDVVSVYKIIVPHPQRRVYDRLWCCAQTGATVVMMSCSLNHLLSDAVHSHSAILRFHQLVVNFCVGNALRSIKTGSHYDFLFLFFSLTYVPRSFPLHINLSPQWDPTDFCAICCILPLLQVLAYFRKSNNYDTRSKWTDFYKCQWSVALFCYTWHNTGYSERGFAIFLSPCMELPIYEFIVNHGFKIWIHISPRLLIVSFMIE